MFTQILYILKCSFIALVFFSSCNEKQEQNSDDGMQNLNFELSYGFFVQNEDGVDLLDQENVNSYSHNNIKLFEDEALTKDISSKFISGVQDANIVNGPNEGGYMIGLGLEMGNVVSEKTEEQISTHEQTYYLQFSESVVDKITVQAISNSNGASLSKLVYNDIVIFSTTQEWKDWDKIIIK